MIRATTILAVDDEPDVLDFVKQGLNRAGYQVLTAHNGLKALEVLESHPVDLIVADIRMPQMNGYQLHERVIATPEWVGIPFLFLTARIQDSEIRYAKELGVDDYLTKPFDLKDLLAAVRGRLRRAQQLAGSPVTIEPIPSAQLDSLTLGRLEIHFGQHRVWMDGHPVKLSAREFELLEYLARRKEEVVSLEALIQVTHGLKTDHVEAGALLRPLVRSLRRKLGYPTGELGCVESVRGVGYRLIPPNG